MKSPSKTNEVTFFLLLIAFISAFNYYLTYSNIQFNLFLFVTYTIDTIQGWLAWWVVRSIVGYLDKKMPYSPHPLKRIGVQLFCTTAAGILVIVLLTEIVSWIAKGRPALPNFYAFDVFIIFIWFLVLNGIYIGMHHYFEWQQSEHQRQEEKKLRAGGFTVKLGIQNLQIAFNEIAGFYAEGSYTYLQSTTDKKYLTGLSLDKTEKLLPEETFYRLNRQYILHRNTMTGFKRAADGKLEILVKGPGNIPAIISVSRTKAAPFKRWFQPDAD